MGRGLKYIIVNDGWGEQVILFSPSLTHAHVAQRYPNMVVAAGFYYDGQAHGESTSLGVVSRMEDDTQLIQEFLNLGVHHE